VRLSKRPPAKEPDLRQKEHDGAGEEAVGERRKMGGRKGLTHH
jgi:hypothetical protein